MRTLLEHGALAGVALAAFTLGCESKRETIIYPEKCDAVCEEVKRRAHDWDLLVLVPGLWKFYDDFAANLAPPPECAGDRTELGGLKPLWRRTLGADITIGPGEFGSAYVSRNPLSVRPGLAAVGLADILWLIDTDGGTPLHAWSLPIDQPFAALTPDAGAVWMSQDWFPAAFDLNDIHKTGPSKTFSYFAYFDSQPRDGGWQAIGSWEFHSPSLGPDGTLFWSSETGDLRAHRPNGELKWATRGAGGYSFANADGTSFWTSFDGPVALSFEDGHRLWTGERWPEFKYGQIIEIERPGERDQLTYAWTNDTGSRTFITQYWTTQGAIRWVREFPASDDVHLSGTDSLYGPHAALSSDGGTLFLTVSYRGGGREGATIYALEGASGATRWTTELASPPIQIRGGPVPGPSNDAVFFTGSDCRLYRLDRDGKIDGWYHLAGRPYGYPPQLFDGILYVIVWVSNGLKDGERVCPGDTGKAAEYGCLTPYPPDCRPCIEGASPIDNGLYFLYAFDVR